MPFMDADEIRRLENMPPNPGLKMNTSNTILPEEQPVTKEAE
jgi:hypothetical protein